jgi:hypothetical protein
MITSKSTGAFVGKTIHARCFSFINSSPSCRGLEYASFIILHIPLPRPLPSPPHHLPSTTLLCLSLAPIHPVPLLHQPQQGLLLPPLFQPPLISRTSPHVVVESFYLQQLAGRRALDHRIQFVLAKHNRCSQCSGNVPSDIVRTADVSVCRDLC